MQPAPGTIIGGKYQLEAMLAKGGMGAVWRAKHIQLQSYVAIKFMADVAASSPTWRARFEREARAAAQLHYTHVVHVHDFGVEDGTPYIVMELLRGESLEDRLKREYRLRIEPLVPIAVQIAKGLRKAHDAGLVHRDLKPANIFLVQNEGDDEVVKIVDFGIAKDTGDTVDNSTKAGEFIGSPHYMSPEQIRDARNIDGRSDLWSLGVILFRALTGVLPFPGDTLAVVIGDILNAPIPMPSRYIRSMPPGADAFFERALARDLTQRFQSAREMAEAFAAVAGMETAGGGNAGRGSSASWVQKDLLINPTETPRDVSRTSDPSAAARASQQSIHSTSNPAVAAKPHDSGAHSWPSAPGAPARPSDPASAMRASSPSFHAVTPMQAPTPMPAPAPPSTLTPMPMPVPVPPSTLTPTPMPMPSATPSSPGEMLSPRQIKTLKMQPVPGPAPSPGSPGMSPGTLTAPPSVGDISGTQGGSTRAGERGRGADANRAKIAVAAVAVVVLTGVVLLARWALRPSAPVAVTTTESSPAAPVLPPSGSPEAAQAPLAPTMAPSEGTARAQADLEQAAVDAGPSEDAGSAGATGAGMPAGEAAPSEKGRVLVSVIGGTCKIAINGLSQGPPPLSVELPVGPNRITCTTPSRFLHQKDITVTPGPPNNVYFRLGGSVPSGPPKGKPRMNPLGI